MLQQLNEEIRECHERAADARRKAQVAADPVVRAEFLDIEGHWLALARSYASTGNVGRVAAADSDGSGVDARAWDDAASDDDTLQLREIRTLHIQGGKLDSLHDRILDAAMGLMSADMGSMQIFHPERNELQLLAWKGFHPESAAFWESVRLDSASTCGLALSAGCRVVISDID